MARKDIGTGWDRNNRNAINDNFEELYEVFRNAGLNAKEAKKKAVEAILQSERTEKELSKAIFKGDSSPLAGQLSVGVDGTVYNSPQERLVKEQERVVFLLTNEIEERNIELQELKEQFNQIGDMTPQEAFPTLQDLENEYPIGKNGVFIVQEDGGWYYWGDSWKRGGNYQASPWDEFMTEQNESWVI